MRSGVEFTGVRDEVWYRVLLAIEEPCGLQLAAVPVARVRDEVRRRA